MLLLSPILLTAHTIIVHVGKCYKALIDSGTAISLLRYSTYKKIEDCYKTPIQPTCARAQSISQCVDAGQLNAPL